AFLANMSHEIRTPLNAIIGLTHLLERDAADGVQRDRLHKVGDAAQHLLQVLNDILDLSKIDAGKLVLEMADFSLAGLLERTCALVAEDAQAKGLLLHADADGLPDALRGDPTRLSQALLNLLSNAVKFTERGSVGLRGTLLGEDAGGLLVRFEVRDTGIGISADDQARLFAAFEQADTSTTRRYGGTGLGLAITRHLAALMGGEIGVASTPGEGSTFWFTARLAHAKAAPACTARPAHGALAAQRLQQAHAGARVLLVEDNPVNREVAIELMLSCGLAVDLATTGPLAIEKAAERDYDLVLMDVQMPGMDGLEATRHIRALPGRGQVPIVALTAHSFGEHRAACIEAGMNDYVSKPVNPEVLFDKLLRWLPEHPATALPPAAGACAGPPGGGAGIDLAQALAQCGGRAESLRRVLRTFVAHYGDGARTLDDALAAADLGAARRFLHSLKGASSAIGAGHVQAQAAAIEAAIAERQPLASIAGAAEPLRCSLDRLVAALRTELGPVDA
ncbi:MAG TPA: ATP-binding protein, partial [Albitalea sp.]